MSATPLSVAFHIGAHKTATTHLQRALRSAADQLAGHGVQYYGPDTLRLPGRSLQSLFGLKHQAPDGMVKRPAAEQLARLRKDGHRLVFSEENFIGALNTPNGGRMKRRYKVADTRLTGLSAAIGQNIDVHLALRRPTAFLNSAYCQLLLGGRVQPFKSYVKTHGMKTVDWVELVRRLRTSHGVGSVTVWRYEDYGALFPHIIAGLVGQDAAASVRPPRRRVNRGLSAAAVAQVLEQAGDLTGQNSARAARKALAVEDGHAPFDGFSEKDHAMGDAAYARQIAEIAQIDGVTLLRPELL